MAVLGAAPQSWGVCIIQQFLLWLYPVRFDGLPYNLISWLAGGSERWAEYQLHEKSTKLSEVTDVLLSGLQAL